MSTVLSAKNVSFKGIIDYPDIEIESGSVTFISGESGCGKSTLLRLFNGMYSPDRGVIAYNGTDAASLDTITLRREVLLCGQSVYLFDKTIRENFAEFYAYRELPPPSDEEISRYLGLCCLDFMPDYETTVMSGGERQRVFIAVCLSLMPKVIMLDEPTSALDTKTSHELMTSIRTHCNENAITAVIVSHDRELTAEYADDIVTLCAKGAM